MNTIFCNSCGQANLPNSNNCLKCNNFIGQGYKVVIPNKKSQDNTNIYWLISVIGAVSFLGTFFLSVLGAGVYISANRSIVKPKPPIIDNRENQNPPKPKVVDTEKKDEVLSKMTNADIQSYINNDLKQVGKYRLVKVGTPKPLFTGANAEQFGGYYPNDNEKEAIVLIIATFPSVADSKNFIEAKVVEINQSGGNLDLHKSNSDGDSLIYHNKSGIGEIIRCNKGICVNVQATTSKDTADFYEAYENRPTK